MKKTLFSFFLLCIASALGAGVVLSSCNREDVITADVAPSIDFGKSGGVYTARAGRPLTIAPDYSHNLGADYCWEFDGEVIATTPTLTWQWEETGSYYLMLTVTNDAGSARAEIRVDVVENGTPVISLPIAGDNVMVALGTDYVIAPEISNSTLEGFACTISIDGHEVATEPTYIFSASATGDYLVEIEASNTDGSDRREFTITVVESLPYELTFPTPSYFQTSTTRYTFAGRPVCLTPLVENLEVTDIVWSVNGARADCSELTFLFTPDKAGEYIVGITVNGSASASVKVVCVDVTEQQRNRKPSASSSARCVNVFEWVPAPGQFIGETKTGGMTGNETTPEAANSWARRRLEEQKYVSLGGFGGYIIVGFDHSIQRVDGDYDFAVMANAFLNAATGAGGSNEPGIVYVMQDVNGNGLPDDEWYELRGSETSVASTRSDYAVTYYRPSGPKMNVQWTDNYGVSGTIDYLAAFHQQHYYYPAWIEADSYTLRGTCLEARTTQDPSTGMWDNSAYSWGYADNMGGDNLTGSDAVTGEGQRNGFLIENAMLPNRQAIKLEYVDFVKIQTGVNSKAGWLGEVSTEVFDVEDLHLSK